MFRRWQKFEVPAFIIAGCASILLAVAGCASQTDTASAPESVGDGPESSSTDTCPGHAEFAQEVERLTGGRPPSQLSENLDLDNSDFPELNDCEKRSLHGIAALAGSDPVYEWEYLSERCKQNLLSWPDGAVTNGSEFAALMAASEEMGLQSGWTVGDISDGWYYGTSSVETSRGSMNWTLENGQWVSTSC